MRKVRPRVKHPTDSGSDRRQPQQAKAVPLSESLEGVRRVEHDASKDSNSNTFLAGASVGASGRENRSTRRNLGVARCVRHGEQGASACAATTLAWTRQVDPERARSPHSKSESTGAAPPRITPDRPQLAASPAPNEGQFQHPKVPMKGLLPLYVTVDTARALLTYALLHSGVKLSPTAISLGCVSSGASE